MTRTRATELLRLLFERRSSVRYPNLERRETDGVAYKKGFEVRLVVSKDEIYDTYKALELLSFYPGNYYSKGAKFVVPIYGRQDFIQFMKLIGWEEYLDDESLWE